MLSRLIISNIALIDELDVELSPGFNVLTGETGAGKSIIIDSVGLILGERGSRELISTGKQKARVEAFFDLSGLSANPSDENDLFSKLDELGIELMDGELIIVREITAAGKSLCRVNGEIVSLNILREITGRLVDVHGQHEHQSLLEPKRHIDILDAFAGSTAAVMLSEIKAVLEEYRAIENRLNAGFVSEAERERRLDILAYQLNEIDSASPITGEEETIEEELKLLSNSERINASLAKSSELLSGESGGALGILREALRAISSISDLSAQYGELSSRLESAFFELEDAAYQLRDMQLSYEYSPERLNELENRLDVLNSLKRKYGGTIEKVLEFRDNAQKELDELTGSEELRAKLMLEKEKLNKAYADAASKLSEIRRAAAEKLIDGVNRELAVLGMEKARFDISIDTNLSELHQKGSDSIEFLLSANPGEPLKPLSKVASGGELSRIMLAIKTVCAGIDGTLTLIFDEVDTGISGLTAVKVGERLSLVSRSKQVLSVTHLPQIAAFTDRHLLVEKHTDGASAHTTLRALSSEERTGELARIMGASASKESAISYAAEMLGEAESFKHKNTND
ncbi:MAG: DNA repair protein RecN [Clostridia bacterium]|nr:DNA repair protein RecN [Clostridia bacterium]